MILACRLCVTHSIGALAQPLVPRDLARVLRPILDHVADYVKGVRLDHREVSKMPASRRFGTRLFGIATRLALQLPKLSDSQCGYTAISSDAIGRLNLHDLWPRYGYPNDLLGQLRLQGLRIAEVSVRPVYGSERSELKLRHAVVIGYLIARVAWRVRTSKPRPAC